MKKSIAKFVFSLAVLLYKTSLAQSFTFHFMAPDTVISKHFPDRPDHANCPQGYSKVNLSSANDSIFDKVAPSNIRTLYAQLQPGKYIRNILDSIMHRPGSTIKQMEYWLVDDRSSFNLTKPKSFGFLNVLTDSSGNHIIPYDTIYRSGNESGKRKVVVAEYLLANSNEISYANLMKRRNQPFKWWPIELNFLFQDVLRRVYFDLFVDGHTIRLLEAENVSAKVIVRKKRNSGGDFTDSIIIDNKYILKNGPFWSDTCFMGEDKNFEAFQYKIYWFDREGVILSEMSNGTEGHGYTVVLYLPVTPREIDFETSLESLKAADISNVTLQVRYKKFAAEFEENIDISCSNNDSLATRTLFFDNKTLGFAYRLIFTHKSEGKLALAWDVSTGVNYIYAVIPEALLNRSSEVFRKASEAGKNIIPADPYGKVTEDKVLDKFPEIFGINKN